MVLTICLLLVAGTSLTLTLMAHSAIHWLSLQKARLARQVAPVSVLRPLRGVDDELLENLESLCCQDHPQYEIILGAADGSDPALQVAREVARRHPELPIRVVVGEWATGLNPKVRVLRSLASYAHYENILISDSNVRVSTQYLSATTAELEDPNVGLVSNPIIGVGSKTFGSWVENLQFNSYVLQGIVLANFIGKHPCVVGKSMLLRCRALKQVGGFEGVADVLAEDYLLGRAVARAGYRVVTSTSPIQSVSNTSSLHAVWQRHLRWAQIRRTLGISGYLLELVLLPNIWLAALAAVSAHSPWARVGNHGLAIVLGCALAYLTVCLSEGLAIRRWSGKRTTVATGVLSAFVRQCLSLSWWVVAWFSNDVVWRGRRLRIGRGSKLQLLPQATDPEAQALYRQVA